LIGEGAAFPRFERLVCYPEGNDVVMEFFSHGNFDKIDRSFSPCPILWFDPEARSTLEMCFEIKVVIEIPITLQQAKTTRGLVKE